MKEMTTLHLNLEIRLTWRYKAGIEEENVEQSYGPFIRNSIFVDKIWESCIKDDVPSRQIYEIRKNWLFGKGETNTQKGKRDRANS